MAFYTIRFILIILFFKKSYSSINIKIVINLLFTNMYFLSARDFSQSQHMKQSQCQHVFSASMYSFDNIAFLKF